MYQVKPLKLPLIHKSKYDHSLECVCGVRLPKNVTAINSLVTCNKCKKILNSNIVVLKK